MTFATDSNAAHPPFPANRIDYFRRAEGASVPMIANRIHTVGPIRLNVTNHGMIGNGFLGMRDPCTGMPAPSLIYPPETGLDYLYAGALWIGGVVNGDTLVSTGWEGWTPVFELFANNDEHGAIKERTTRYILRAGKDSKCPDVGQSPDAVSEQDFITTFSDTITSPLFVQHDPMDGRLHRPLGVEITQHSYAWSLNAEQGFLIFDNDIRNITSATLHDVYIGIHMHQDVSHGIYWTEPGWLDDLTGMLRTTPASLGEPYMDTVDVAWTADNNGDPVGGEFDEHSITGIAGVRLLSGRQANLKQAFNWWSAWAWRRAAPDWGPARRYSRVDYLWGGRGKPLGDPAKYMIMSNGEMDYDQIYAAQNRMPSGWLPPPSDPAQAADLADGNDVSYTLSLGPYTIPPDSSVNFVYAIVAASDFHTDPQNFARYYDPIDPSLFYSRLNFKALGVVAQYAGWVYDVPGLDTDLNGYRGKYRVAREDTVYYEGDGVPDYRIAPPPPSPTLRTRTREGMVILTWNGYVAETTKDPFSSLADFEAYRVYMTRTAHYGDWALLAQRDVVNWTRYRWRPEAGLWRSDDPPFTLDSLRRLYDSICVADYGYAFHPDSFNVRDPARAFLEEVFDPRDPSKLDTNLFYFVPFNDNLVADDRTYAELAANGREITGVIRKLYPDAPEDSVGYREDGTPFLPFYEYEYAIDGLLVAEPIFLTVTTSDFGYPLIGLAPQESSPTANAEQVWPINSAEVVKSEHPKPGVYPNPYRISDDYNGAGWENPRGLEPDRERARKMTFYNVPDTCIVSIWSLDGDLIRRLDHKSDPASSEASVVVWNLITRNTQAIKTGIYLYSIESQFGTDVGKLVIIK